MSWIFVLNSNNLDAISNLSREDLLGEAFYAGTLSRRDKFGVSCGVKVPVG